METLSHGFKKPESGDNGAIFFPALEENMQLLNDHTHNGTDSEKLGVTSSEAYVQTPTMNWVDTGDGSGTFRTLVTLPAPLVAALLTFDLLSVTLRSLTGEGLYLPFAKASASTFNVYSNDSSLAFKVVYTT